MIVLNSYSDIERVQKWIISIINDLLAKILLKNSHITKIQLETLLINDMSEHVLDKRVGYEDKSKMRLSKVSRGAFNRTLHQARKNILGSLYTVLLIGYLGILETPSLDPLIEASNKLDTYMKEYYLTQKDRKINKNRTKMLSILKEELEISLQKLEK